MSARTELEAIIAAASKTVGIDHLPEIVPAAEERYFDERGDIADMLAMYAEDVADDTKMNEVNRTDGLAYFALRSADLHVMRAVFAYNLRKQARSEIARGPQSVEGLAEAAE